MFGGQLLVTPTGRRLNGVAELQAILAEVRERGYAENWEETADGLYAASVPIVSDGNVTLAALTTCIPISRISTERREAIVAYLMSLGATLSESIGWLPSFSSRRP
jgi:IclR family KDG regulon transcriptional repressor